METQQNQQPIQMGVWDKWDKTGWEAKEEAGLLALETEERRRKRLIAEDSDTAANVLGQFAREALDERTPDRFAWFNYLKRQRENPTTATGETKTGDNATEWKRAKWRRSELLLQALAVHPNTPSDLLAELIGTTPLIPQVTRAFFRNPIAPSLLESPDFIARIDVFCQLLLLREASALPSFVQRLASSKVFAPAGEAEPEGAAQAAAQMHIAVAGELIDPQIGQADMQTYWQRQWGAIIPYSRTHKWQANLLPEKAESPRWTDRVQAISQAEAIDVPLHDDAYERTGLDLLHYLARDGNRFVRWEAKTKLAKTKSTPDAVGASDANVG